MTPAELAAEIVRMTREVEKYRHEVSQLRVLIVEHSGANCTCGGSGPDVDSCEWCFLYHAAKEVQ